MADRARNGGGVAFPISVSTGANVGAGLASQNPSAGIVQGTGADWFGPGNPLRPVAPREVEGRTIDFQPAYNLIQTKRKQEALKPETLRGLARGYPVLATVIETRKDQMVGLSWGMTPRDDTAKITPDQEARAKKIVDYFKKPERGYNYQTWARRLLDDLFILDAPTLYPRMTRGGGLYELVVFDGGTINRVIDDWGRTPEAPTPAYEQILHGLAAVDYTVDQLIYRPRNPRPDKIFGFSPVEQIVAIVNIAIRRETWQLKFFSEGSQPDALIGTPADWTPDQVRAFQDWWDSVQQNDAGGQRGVRFVPGEVAKSYVQTKQTELFGAAEEWLARVICFAFSISPSAFTKMTNRATAETQHEAAIEEGLQPLKSWFAALIEEIAETYFDSPDLKLQWDEEEEIDQIAESTMLVSEVHAGLRSIDEGRAAKGLEPLGGDYARPMAYSPTLGYVPISVDDQIADTKKKVSAGTIADPAAPPPAPHGSPGASAQGGGGGASPSRAAPGNQGHAVGSGGGGAAASGGSKKASEAAALAKGEKRLLTVDRAAGKRAVAAMAKAVSAALEKAGAEAAGEVAARLKHAVGKADNDKTDPVVISASQIDAIVAAIDLSSLDKLVDATEDALFDMYQDSALKALAMVGVKKTDELVNRVNTRAVEWASERAAELVGKRFTPEGALIDNPRPGWAIDDLTRVEMRALIAKGLDDNIGTPAIADSIQEAYAFSADRADLIARTEVSTANEQGKMDGWREAQDAGVALQKSWLTMGEACDECDGNEAQGAIDLDADFDSGDDAPPGHPNCRCVLIPEVVETDDGADQGGDENV